MRYAYYPGCSLDSTGIEFNLSTKAVCAALGVELVEIPDWNCCGASSAHVANPWLAISLPARNLAIAEAENLDVAIPCAACYARSKKAELFVEESEENRQKVARIVGKDYKGQAKARALVDVLWHEVGLEKIQNKVINPLKGLKVLTYYGCLFVRPAEIAFDDVEDPQCLDEMMEALGAEVLPWGYKTECCGGSMSACKREVGYPMIEKILDAAKKSGADCIVTSCPMCMANLDMRQQEIGKKQGKIYDIPIYYMTELMGLSFGMKMNEMGVDRHFVNEVNLVNTSGQEGHQ